jgi:hypothetical protein
MPLRPAPHPPHVLDSFHQSSMSSVKWQSPCGAAPSCFAEAPSEAEGEAEGTPARESLEGATPNHKACNLTPTQPTRCDE